MSFQKVIQSRIQSQNSRRQQVNNDHQHDYMLQITGQSISSPKTGHLKNKLQQSNADIQLDSRIDYKQITARYNEINPYLEMILSKPKDDEIKNNRPISGLFQETYATLDKKEKVINNVKKQLQELQMGKLNQKYQ